MSLVTLLFHAAMRFVWRLHLSCFIEQSTIKPGTVRSSHLPSRILLICILFLLPTSLNLPGRGPAPHTLQVSIPLCQSVDTVVTLSHSAHESAKRICLVLAGVAAVFVDFGEAELHGCVVLGFDDAVGCAALAGDVTVGDFVLAYCLNRWSIEKVR